MSLIDVLKEQADILEASGYTVAFIGIYGSQNYGLDVNTDEYQSDIDMKAVVVPTLDNLIRNSKPVSTVVDTEWGQCDIKDIRVFFETLMKANPAYVEVLYTDHLYVNPKFEEEVNQILSLKDELMEALAPQFMKAMYGMLCEKAKAMCHPYPSILHKIEKYGYDGKQLSHAYRLLVMMDDYFNKKKPLKECFYPSGHTRGIIIDMKLNKMPLEIAKERIEVFLEDGKAERDKYLSSVDYTKIDFSVKDKFLMLSQEIIKNKIVEEIRQ